MYFAQIGLEKNGSLGADHVENRLAKQFVTRVSRHRASTAVYFHVKPFWTGNKDTVGRLLDQGAELLLAGAKVVIGPHQLQCPLENTIFHLLVGLLDRHLR